jgi:carboxylesterase type B
MDEHHRVLRDCLNLNIVRPSGSHSKLPVLIWLHGGSFFFNSNQEITSQPDGLVLRSVEIGTPIIHVSINYRLGVFGFAQSAALKADKSENLGLRDQRLALEWIRDNIEAFGGDPDRITLHGQSSGGVAVGIQSLALEESRCLSSKQYIRAKH